MAPAMVQTAAAAGPAADSLTVLSKASRSNCLPQSTMDQLDDFTDRRELSTGDHSIIQSDVQPVLDYHERPRQRERVDAQSGVPERRFVGNRRAGEVLLTRIQQRLHRQLSNHFRVHHALPRSGGNSNGRSPKILYQ